ncbi:MarR family transcriptional regulator [Streptomyces hygroscopicus]|uniref:MarR family transcriptional regulator n=1 Tax=Streptomyces hygroscopicus TaxID=1912 RepID=UPI00223F4DB0|nr:helix-turn-helix domain-containing protein [Streptomyces hygroscopicus]
MTLKEDLRRVIEALEDGSTFTRAEMRERTGISAQSVSYATNILISEGWIEYTGMNRHGTGIKEGGRYHQIFQVTEKGRYEINNALGSGDSGTVASTSRAHAQEQASSTPSRPDSQQPTAWYPPPFVAGAAAAAAVQTPQQPPALPAAGDTAGKRRYLFNPPQPPLLETYEQRQKEAENRFAFDLAMTRAIEELADVAAARSQSPKAPPQGPGPAAGTTVYQSPQSSAQHQSQNR